MTHSLVQRVALSGFDWIVPAWDAPRSVHALSTTRNGGVSTGARAALDLGGALLPDVGTGRLLGAVDEPGMSSPFSSLRGALPAVGRHVTLWCLPPPLFGCLSTTILGGRAIESECQMAPVVSNV